MMIEVAGDCFYAYCVGATEFNLSNDRLRSTDLSLPLGRSLVYRVMQNSHQQIGCTLQSITCMRTLVLQGRERARASPTHSIHIVTCMHTQSLHLYNVYSSSITIITSILINIHCIVEIIATQCLCMHVYIIYYIYLYQHQQTYIQRNYISIQRSIII